ncbi:MAG TPA: hypothetical protein VGD79_04470 [Thermoanaerobaculia bacterium]
MLEVAAMLVPIMATLLCPAPALAQTDGNVLTVPHELFLTGYTYGKLFRYYSRSLANFDTLTSAQKNADRDIMIDLSVDLEAHAQSLRCKPQVLQGISALESELSARGKPKEGTLARLDGVHECVDDYNSDLIGYWWTGRSVGSLSWLFENLEHPQIDVDPSSADQVLLGELQHLSQNSVLLYDTAGFPPPAKELLKSLEGIRRANANKRELDTGTRNLVKRYVNDIRRHFLIR